MVSRCASQAGLELPGGVWFSYTNPGAKALATVGGPQSIDFIVCEPSPGTVRSAAAAVNGRRIGGVFNSLGDSGASLLKDTITIEIYKIRYHLEYFRNSKETREFGGPCALWILPVE